MRNQLVRIQFLVFYFVRMYVLELFIRTINMMTAVTEAAAAVRRRVRGIIPTNHTQLGTWYHLRTGSKKQKNCRTYKVRIYAYVWVYFYIYNIYSDTRYLVYCC